MMAIRRFKDKDGWHEEEYESDEEKLIKELDEAKDLTTMKDAIKRYFGYVEVVEDGAEPDKPSE